jgi:hypothetical protein
VKSEFIREIIHGTMKRYNIDVAFTNIQECLDEIEQDTQ